MIRWNIMYVKSTYAITRQPAAVAALAGRQWLGVGTTTDEAVVAVGSSLQSPVRRTT